MQHVFDIPLLMVQKNCVFSFKKRDILIRPWMTYVHSLFQILLWSRLIKQDLQEKLFQKLVLPRLLRNFCCDQTFDLIEKL